MVDWSKHSSALQVFDPARAGRQGWLAVALLLGPALLTLGYSATTGKREPDWTVMLGVFAALGGLAVVVDASGVSQTPAPGTLSQQGRDLVLTMDKHQWQAPLTSFHSGWVTSEARGPWLELRHRDGTRWRIGLQDARAGEALLDRLRLSRRFRRTTVVVGPEAPLGLRLGLAALLGFAVNLLMAGDWPAGWNGPPGELATMVGLFALIGVVLLCWRGHRLTIGNDGIHWRGRFIAASDIVAVHRRCTRARLELAGGALLRLRFPPWAWRKAAGIAARLLRLLEMAEEAAVLPAGAQALARGDRAAQQWLAGLAPMLDGGSDYRSLPLSAQDAERVLCSPHAGRELRFAAAVALTCGGKQLEHAEVLRAAARASADPTLRRLLAGLAAGGLQGQRLVRALADMAQAR